MRLLHAVFFFKEESPSKATQGYFSVLPVHSMGLPQELLKTAAAGNS